MEETPQRTLLIGGRNKFFSAPLIYTTSCANRPQLATALSTRDTCTVCGHPTMSNYFTMYKIVSSSSLHLPLRLSLLLFKQLQIGSTHVLFVATPLLQIGSTHVLFVATPLLQIGYSRRRGESLDDCLSLKAETNFVGSFHI